jgi:carbon monoxide dehydrogenase subunit G
MREAVMEFKDQFVLQVAIGTAWRFMSNPQSFSSCIPGYVAGTMKIIDEKHFQLTVKQSIARIPAKYQMSVEILEMTKPNRLVAQIRGRDPLLGSNIDARSVLLLSSTEDGSTAVSYLMELNVTGKVATFGYPVIASKGKTFSREFVVKLIHEISILRESDSSRNDEDSVQADHTEHNAEILVETNTEENAELNSVGAEHVSEEEEAPLQTNASKE